MLRSRPAHARIGIALDVAENERLKAIVADGRFEILVNNAGGADTGPFAEDGCRRVPSPVRAQRRECR